MRLVTLLLGLTFLLGCPEPAVMSPTFVEIPDTDMCPSMCVHFRDLHCAEGTNYYDNDKPGPKGIPNATCEEFCQRQQTNGVFENPRCLLKVPTCDLIETWRQKDCRPDAGTP